MNKTTLHNSVRNVSVLALLATLILPWYLPYNPQSWLGLSSLWHTEDFAVLIAQASRFNRPWLLPLLLTPVLAIWLSFKERSASRGNWLVILSVLTIAYLMYTGFAIGPRQGGLGLTDLVARMNWR